MSIRTRQDFIRRFNLHPHVPVNRRVDEPLRKRLRPAAVLIPIIERQHGLSLILTQRSAKLRQHAGQISFPGGRYEHQDQHLLTTALRETEEEIGLARRHIDLIGRIDDYYTVTGYQVTPVIGLVTPPFDLTPDDHEVAEVFEVPLEFILNPRNQKLQTVTFEGTRRRYFATAENGNKFGFCRSVPRGRRGRVVCRALRFARHAGRLTASLWAIS